VTAKTVYAALMRPPPILAHARNDIPAELQRIFERAIAKDVKARYQTAGQMRESLEELLKQGPYPTVHDLAAWVRKIMALERGPGQQAAPTNVRDHTETTSDCTVVEGRASELEPTLVAQAKINGADDEN